MPQRWKTSTPTMYDGLIWQEFLKGDQRRYFVPCPCCSKPVSFAWSPAFFSLPKRGDEAYIVWDATAKRPNGTWDLDRVAQSAHAKCPHCGGRITSDRKTQMIRDGHWSATNPAAPAHFRSRHLSSLYSTAQQCSFGALAVKFLQAKHGLLGLQGFINGELAEPYLRQDRQADRVKLSRESVDIGSDWVKLMTVDCQQRAPLFWCVVRAWHGGSSHALWAGPLNSWAEVEAKQAEHGINNAAVGVDAGFGAKAKGGNQPEVYRHCAEHSETEPSADGLPYLIGWQPMKGMSGRNLWSNDKGLATPYKSAAIDLYQGTSLADQTQGQLLEFRSDFFKDLLDRLRDPRNSLGVKWTVSPPVDTDEYWLQLDAEVRNDRTGFWEKLNAHRANHLLDCEVMQLALASFLGMFEADTQKP